MKVFIPVFITIFLAELGDKTQIATMLFASNNQANKLVIFFAAALALVGTSLIGVLLGGVISNYVDEKTLKLIGGLGFLIVGVWTLFSR